MLEILLLGLAFVLIALVSGNNLSACSGAIIGSRITSKRMGVLIAIVGFILGLALEGSMLKKGIEAIMPVSSNILLVGSFSIAIIVFLLADRFRVPVSLTIAFTSLLLGIGVALGKGVNAVFVLVIFAFWILMPLASIVSMPMILSAVEKRLRKGSIWQKVHVIKFSLILVSFFTSFTLGANTLGLIYASFPFPNEAVKLLVSITAIVIGSIFISQGEIKRLGDEIISLRYVNALLSQFVSAIEVEIATLFGVPLSNTQTFTASLYGIGYGYKARLMRRKPAYEILLIWFVSALLSFLLAFWMTKLYLL